MRAINVCRFGVVASAATIAICFLLRYTTSICVDLLIFVAFCAYLIFAISVNWFLYLIERKNKNENTTHQAQEIR